MDRESLSQRRLKHELPEDIEFESSPNQVRQFLEHVTWRDLREYLEDHIQWCYGQMENVQTLEDLKDHQGQVKMAKAVLGFPNHVIEHLEIEEA